MTDLPGSHRSRISQLFYSKYTGLEYGSACRLLVPIFMLALFTVCTQPKVEEPKLPATVEEEERLIVLTRNAPTTYYLGREEMEGIEHDMIVSFAAQLGVEPEFRVLETTAEILEAIKNNEGHLAAAGLTRTPEREQIYPFGPDYQTVRQQVICRRGTKIPKDLKRLSQKSLVVIAGSSYEERLQELKKDYPKLQWVATREMETEELLERVYYGQIDCTVADSNIVSLNRRYLPELEVAFDLSEPEPLAWVIAPEHAYLQSDLETWHQEQIYSWNMEQWIEQYYGYTDAFDYVDIKRFHRRIEERLPQFEGIFKRAETRYGFSWVLLAAQSYQESQWRVNARSPTGVRGLMMLTLRTAKQVGVVDRLNPEESIMGGAKYMANLYKRLPDTICEPDRIWIALACYNVGYGHVMDARKLARQKGLDPDLWHSLQEVLPLLAKREYYRKLRYGYARGWEPVRYVQRIRDFQDMLEQYLLVTDPADFSYLEAGGN